MATQSLPVPYRQIRAQFDKETITVYQAYSAEIAIPAVLKQNLAESICFSFLQMFTDDLDQAKLVLDDVRYRSGYSYKDNGQSHILALKMKHEHFHQLLSVAGLAHGQITEEEKMRPVRVQWDPERTPTLETLPYRSIQIGISNQLSRKWVNEWIVSIEDVTTTARALKAALDADGTITVDSLVEKRLVPKEDVYRVSEELQRTLKMEDEVNL